MQNQVDQKVIDPEAELSNAQRTFKRLAPICSVDKRALGITQLATQEKQMNILKNEFNETSLCIKLATKGQHAVRDAKIKDKTKESILRYESLDLELKDEQSQVAELNILDDLAQKTIQNLYKTVPTEVEELELIEKANNSLRRMENRLDLATKKLCVVNADNNEIRDEIQMLLVDRNAFNIQWNRIIGKLMKGKEYLMDIFEIASAAFGAREECCRKLDALKWKGLFQLNKDVSEMQGCEGDINHLAKLEEFLRTKGTKRICEVDEKADIKRYEEMLRCETKIDELDELLNEIFNYAGTSASSNIMTNFASVETENFSCFHLLCKVVEQSIGLRKEVDILRQTILDAYDQNEATQDKHQRKHAKLTAELAELQAKTQGMMEQYVAAENAIIKCQNGIAELVSLARCDITPLLVLLGNHREVTKWNVMSFLHILECEIKSLLEVGYGAISPPKPTPRRRTQEPTEPKLVADPCVPVLRPNIIEKLVPYLPCAYCVQDFIMNQVFETPAEVIDKKYIDYILHMEKPNTKFGIYTLTIPNFPRDPVHCAQWKNIIALARREEYFDPKNNNLVCSAHFMDITKRGPIFMKLVQESLD